MGSGWGVGRWVHAMHYPDNPLVGLLGAGYSLTLMGADQGAINHAPTGPYKAGKAWFPPG